MVRVSIHFLAEENTESRDTRAGTVQGLLDELGLSREVFVVKLNGEVVTEEEPLSEGDAVELVKVVSGG